MSRRLPGPKGGHRTALVAVAVALATGLAAYGGAAAGAAPKPTVSQVRAQVNKLQAQIDQVGQQYDQATGQLSAARSKLAAVRHEVTREQGRFNAARADLARIAVGAYENSAQDSAAGLFTSADPAVILGQASLMQQLASTHQEKAAQLLTSARHLSSVQAQLQHTEDGIAALHTQLAARKTALGKLLSGRQALLDSLTTAQQGQVGAGGVGAGGTVTAAYTGPTSTQAGKAVAFAYAQLGKPYVWGAPPGLAATTARDWSRPPGRPPGYPSPGSPTTSGPPSRTSPSPRSSPGTCCSITARATCRCTSAAATSSTHRGPA